MTNQSVRTNEISGDAETVTCREPESDTDAVRALFVTGPSVGRHVLPMGLVTLGRGLEATILVNDPRVSRLHAALHVEREIMVNDLGSANGTFLGSERLARGDTRRLAEGQPFFLGDSALVVRTCSLRRTAANRLTSMDEVVRRFSGESTGDECPMVVLRVRPMGKAPPWIWEAVLGDALKSPRDWLLRLDGGQLLVGIEASVEADVRRIERAILETLVGWSLVADVKGRLLSLDQLDRAGKGLRAVLSGDAPLELVRGKIVVREPAMKALEQAAYRVASASVNVLILGETGAGKDVVASMIHERSARSDKPFLGLNCASLPEPLLESELFGYERGAFTGAMRPKPGLLESADGGTVFLDEIGDLPLSLQAKLLRIIESREVMRLGALKPRVIDVRFIAATNHDLERDAAEGRFRQDLYYRLNSVILRVPPLRERPLEIEPLARLFLEEASARFETGEIRFSPAAISALCSHPWTGNVRELKSAVERAALLATGHVIHPPDLGLPSSALDLSAPHRASAPQPVEHQTLPDLERERIVHALEGCGGNQSRAAKLLGMSRRTLVRKIAQLGLPRPRSDN
jgi:DNA-binding NtrC family response regulator